MSWLERVVVDADVVHGRPRVRGTHVRGTHVRVSGPSRTCRRAAIVLAVLSAGACSAGETPDPPEDVARYSPAGRGEGGLDAQLLGTLARVDGCVYVIEETTGIRTIPVFPDDRAIRWDDDALRVGSRAYVLDSTADLGGGEGGAGLPGFFLPEGCDEDAPLFAVNT